METILFLIIAGILSSIFGKVKGKSNSGRTKPFTAKGFNDFRTKLEQQMENTPRTEQISTGKPVIKETHFQDLEKYEEIRQNPVMSNVQAGPMISVEPSEDDSLKKVEEKTIINGIIWSEILGEPRAKKPYFSRKS